MTIRVTCDGCGKIEEPRRDDISEIENSFCGEFVIRDYCGKCEREKAAEIKTVLGEK